MKRDRCIIALLSYLHLHVLLENRRGFAVPSVECQPVFIGFDTPLFSINRGDNFVSNTVVKLFFAEILRTNVYFYSMPNHVFLGPPVAAKALVAESSDSCREVPEAIRRQPQRHNPKQNEDLTYMGRRSTCSAQGFRRGYCCVLQID